MPHSRKNGKYWIDKTEFYDAVKDHYELRKNNPDLQLTPYITQCLTNIAHGVMSRYNFSRYSYRDEMIADALLTLVRYFKTFNPEKSNNPYGYFWLAAYRSGQGRINIENKQQAIKAKKIQSMFIDDDSMTSTEMHTFKMYMEQFSEFDLDKYENKKAPAKNTHYKVTTKAERDNK